MIRTKSKERVSCRELKSFVDRNNIKKLQDVGDEYYTSLVQHINHAVVTYLKYNEFYAINRGETLSSIFSLDKINNYVLNTFDKSIYRYEEKTLEVFDIDDMVNDLIRKYNFDAADARTQEYISKGKPQIVPKERLKSPFNYLKSWFELSAGLEIVSILPLTRKVVPIPIKVSSKVTLGAKIQVAANCLALSDINTINDRFFDLVPGRSISPPNYGILALHDGSEEIVFLDDLWYDLHSYIGEFLEFKERNSQRKRKK